MADNGFSDRRKRFEAEYKRNQDLAFRVKSRRDRLFGQWVADKLALSDAEKDAYARRMVGVGIAADGDRALTEAAMEDLIAHGLVVTPEDCAAALSAQIGIAETEVFQEWREPDGKSGG